MSRSRKPKPTQRDGLPAHARFARVRNSLALIGVAQWLTALAARLAKDPDEEARVERVRVYLAALVAGTAGEPPVHDIAFAAGLLGAAIHLPPDDPDDGGDPPPCAQLGGIYPHAAPLPRVVRAPFLPAPHRNAFACAY